MFLLDTCIWIPFLKGRWGIQEHVQQVGVSNCFLSELVVAELLIGAYKTGREAEFRDIRALRSVFETLPVSYAVLDRYAQLRASLETQGSRLDNIDLLIAATALANDLTLVTHNTRHFSRIPDLKLEDWIETEAQ